MCLDQAVLNYFVKISSCIILKNIQLKTVYEKKELGIEDRNIRNEADNFNNKSNQSLSK